MELPDWEPRAGRALKRLQRAIPLLGAVTPINLRAELSALEQAFAAGQPRAPRFVYAARPADVRTQLHNVERQLAQFLGPLAELYRARTHELWLEAQLCQLAGSAGFVDFAIRRYQRTDTFAAAADELARDWVNASTAITAPTIISDDEADPRSLVRRMRAEVGCAKLACRVEVSARLAALAATGPGVIYVASGQPLSVNDTERTVLHEVYGHALPAALAARSPLQLASLGSAHGSDEQEGRALLLEQRAALLSDSRKAELARRHLAARAAHRSAEFVDIVTTLQDYACPLRDALRITARTMRGGGLGRECAYLPAMLRVQSAVHQYPQLDERLATGKWSIAAAQQLVKLGNRW